MRFYLLDPLRGIAALWVFAFHYSFSDRFQEAWPQVHGFFKLGDLGVPMFFVISGYCITASARGAIRKNEATRSFLYRRLKRIYPPFWCSIAVVVAIPFLMEFLSSLKTGTFVAPSAEQSLNYGFLNYSIFEWVRVSTLTQVFWPVEEAGSLQYKFTTINAVYWTLAIEVQFYCVVAIALFISRERFYWGLALTTLLCLPFTWQGSLLVTGLFVPFWPMFAVGSMLFFILEKQQEVNGHSRLRFATLILASILFLITASRGIEPSWMIFAVYFATCLWLAKPIDHLLEQQARHPYLKYIATPLMMLGAMSFSLYLLHGRLQFLTGQATRQILPAGSILYDVAVIAGTCLLVWPFYLFCEAPFFKSNVSADSNQLDGKNPETTAIMHPTRVSEAN